MFALDKSPRKYKCPKCGQKTFTKYLTNDGYGEPISDDCGRCDREVNCGYHFPPRAYFYEHPEERKNYPLTEFAQVHKLAHKLFEPVANPSVLPKSIVEKSLPDSLESDFCKYLLTVFPREKVAEASQRYFLGCNNQGRVIYWQVDDCGMVRDGKIVPYGKTGHRIHDDGTHHINWVSSRLGNTEYVPFGWHHNQCFFGQHLLNATMYPSDAAKPVAIVEGEKTAVICSIVYPQVVWLSVGGKENLVSFLRNEGDHLRGKTVQVYPDKGCFADWDKVVYPIIY